MANQSSGPQVTAEQSLVNLVEAMGDGVKTAGGDWTYEERTRAWVPGTAPGYQPIPCGASSTHVEHYEFSLWGPGMPDTDAASARMAKHRMASGYDVRTVYRDGPKLGNGIQIFVDLPQGAYLGYVVSNHRSRIVGASVCLPAATFPPLS